MDTQARQGAQKNVMRQPDGDVPVINDGMMGGAGKRSEPLHDIRGATATAAAVRALLDQLPL